jgi:HK97 family phage portal protein
LGNPGGGGVKFASIKSWLPWSRKSTSTLDIFREIYGSKMARAGVTVNWDAAIRVSTVLACARVIAQGIAQVPLKVYRESNGTKLPATDHPLYFLLHNQPNPWQTSFEYRETMGLHLALAGRHYAFRNVDSAGVLRELIPFEPGKVEPKRIDGGEIEYTVTFDNGMKVSYPQTSIWHVRGLGWNGWQGMDAVDLAREAIGLSIAAESAHAKLFANGVQSKGTYSVERTLNPEQYKQLRKHIVENTTGDNAGMPMIVDQGAKWLQTAMTGEDAQHVELRRHQIEEVCRAMGVMPIMVGHSDKTATYASAEQMFIAHVVHTLTPWYVRLEQSIDAHLLGRVSVEQGFYSKFVAQGLMRGAMKDRGEYLSKALGAGGSPAWMTQDEARGLEELNPLGGSAAVLPQATNVPKGANDGAN